MKILHIDSSITGPRSVSRELSALIVGKLRGSGEHEVTYRDIVAEDLPHFTAVTAPSAHPLSKAMPTLDEAQQAKRDNSDAILREFVGADAVVHRGADVQLHAPVRTEGLGRPPHRAGHDLPVRREWSRGPGRRQARHSRDRTRGRLWTRIRGCVRGACGSRSSAWRWGFIGVKNIEVVIAEGLNVADGRDQAIASARGAVTMLAA